MSERLDPRRQAIKPSGILKKEYEEFIKPYWEESFSEFPLAMMTTELRRLMHKNFKEFKKIDSERKKREKEIRRAEDYEEWCREQQKRVPQVKLLLFNKLPWEKCPIDGYDVGSVWPPRPVIRAFDLPELKDQIPCVPIFKGIPCGHISADYNRYFYVKREVWERTKDPYR